jgi:AcrR family transcriptional regulator
MPRKKNIPDETILDVAREVFISDGIGASTRKIAEQAGVSEGVIFQRFDSKMRLFFAAMRLPPPDFAEAIVASEACPDLFEALFILTKEILQYLRSIMPNVLLVLSHPARKEIFSRHGDGTHDLLFEGFGLNQVLVRFFDQQMIEKTLRPRDYQLLSSILLSVLLTRAFHEQMGIDEPDATEAWLEPTLRVLID